MLCGLSVEVRKSKSDGQARRVAIPNGIKGDKARYCHRPGSWPHREAGQQAILPRFCTVSLRTFDGTWTRHKYHIISESISRDAHQCLEK